ncbi:hypothetical protein LOK49_LG06G02993 [Camellia lanceoleosa]|uniref:Uncharacterized protein n=1 Tax=Camellia lanceoleosa TaxID=1840588 RepID=A0ACC0HHQ9_9ERIC|nr:hypothetical protein LOK49_LG06G02993 [Camellia lanceoleosa]
MLSSFSPCMNFITNSTASGTSPTTDCCNSLRSLASNGMACLCLIATGSVPFQIPINRTVASSLPRACNMPRVPVQCKASVAPIPVPGPIALSPTLSPSAAAPLSPQAASVVPNPVSPALAPEADTTPLLTPPSPTMASEAPTANSGSRPVLTPSAATPPHNFSPFLQLALLAAIVLKYYY